MMNKPTNSGHKNFVANLQKMKLNNSNIDLFNVNVHTILG